MGKCITKRVRAEKRRLTKEKDVLGLSKGEEKEDAGVDENVSDGSKTNNNASASTTSLTLETSTANWANCKSRPHNIAKLGREMSELLELALDAQLRLRRAVHASKSHDKRRLLFEEC